MVEPTQMQKVRDVYSDMGSGKKHLLALGDDVVLRIQHVRTRRERDQKVYDDLRIENLGSRFNNVLNLPPNMSAKNIDEFAKALKIALSLA